MQDTPNAPLSSRYYGTAGAMFRLSFVTSLLTVLTFGIYRFWAKTRVRRYIWSSVRIDGDALEYTGTGLEKLLGFLVAVVILAVYLGLVQVLLTFAGLNLFIEPTTNQQALMQLAGFWLTTLAVLPLMFYAEYRAYRYKLSRTRWRGIRFGMDKAPWGYTWRALVYWALSLLSLGLLAPLMTFRLAQYRTDRTWFGDEKFRQEGRWTALYAGMKHIVIALVVLVGGVTLGALADSPLTMGMLGVTGWVWLFVGGVHYQLHALRVLTEGKRLTGDLRFHVAPSTGEIAGRILMVGLGITVLSAVAFALIGVIFQGVFMRIAATGAVPEVGPFLLIALAYFLTYLAIGALIMAWIVQPVLREVVRTFWIANPEALIGVHQRAAADNVDAEGFADALDLGGAF